MLFPGSWRSARSLRFFPTLCLLLALVMGQSQAKAHDLPDDLTLHGFIKPDEDRLHFVIRLPLAMLLNIGLPKRGPGYIDLAQSDEALEQAARATAEAITLFENGERLTPETARSRLSQPSEDAFGSYTEATAHIAGPPPPVDANIFWNQGYFDLHLTYPIASASSRFALDMQAGGKLSDRTQLIVHFLRPDDGSHVYQLQGGHGWLDLDPTWHAAAWTFIDLGFMHILDGPDHLLFLFCLILPFGLRQFWPLAGTVTAFTIAHSITLISAALGYAPSGDWFLPLVEALVTFSILYMACENVIAAWRGRAEASDAVLNRRWLIAGLFGLIHGFAFSFILQNQLQLAGEHVLLSLLAFNLGVEFAQLALLLAILPSLAFLLDRSALRSPWVLILSLLAGQIAWFWFQDRALALRYVRWPEIDPAAAGAYGVILLLLSGAGLLALLSWRQQAARRAAGSS